MLLRLDHRHLQSKPGKGTARDLDPSVSEFTCFGVLGESEWPTTSTLPLIETRFG